MTNSIALSEDQRDCLQEIVNVAMGQAGDSLARFLEVFINLSVPRIRSVSAKELPRFLNEIVDNSVDNVSAVRQGFYSLEDGRGVRGESIVIFSDTSFKELADLLAYEDDVNSGQSEIELLLDVTNVLTGACLNGIADQIGEELAYSSPSILGYHVPPNEVVSPRELQWEYALLVEIHYRLERRAFSCTLLLLMPGDAIQVIKNALDKMLDEL
jgi:chemotaxis protein CheC